MKINTKRIMSITLATLITAGSTGIYASNFKDVPTKHWAKGYIDTCEELGLLRGYGDGTFKPSTHVSKLETLVTLARTLNVPQSEVIKATQKYKAVLVKNKVPNWAIDDMSVALSRGIADENMLTTLFDKKGTQLMGNREDLAVLLVNTMSLQKEVKDKGVITKLPFVDAAKVTKAKMPHVLVIKEKGIFTGDERKNFNPKNTITRGEMAKVLDLTYKQVNIGKPAPENPKVTTVLGTTDSTFTTSGENYLIVNTVTGEKKSYKIDSKSVLKLDGKVLTFKDLVAGINVKIEISGESANVLGTIVTLTGNSLVENLKGAISEIKDTGTKTLTLSYTENGAQKQKFAIVNEDAIIMLDGYKATFNDIKARDKASLEIVNGKVTKIDAQSTARTWTGELIDVNLVNKSIVIETADKTKTLLGLDKDVVIMRNDKQSDLSALRKSDKIDIVIENNLIKRIDAKVVVRKVSGLVQRTSIGYDGQEITILNSETKKEETYKIPANAEIKLDGQLANLSKFKLGDFTTIVLESNELVKLEGQSTTTDKHLGIITYKDLNSLTITLNNGSHVKVNLLPTTLYKNDDGQIINFSDINGGDSVLLTGELYQGNLSAKEVMKLK